MAYKQIKSSNKFKAVKQEYGGKWYHSKGEAAYAQELDWRVKAGEILSWEGQYKIDLKVNGIHICNYYVDFKVVTKHGSIEFHEYKGFETMEWKMKWNLLNALISEIEPGAELIVVKHKSYYKK
jgi:uncharacterized pyridoxamine 5'-phosphate oxidase family protein